MSALTSPKTYTALGAFHAVDAVLCGIQVPPIKKVLDDVGLPDNIRPVLPVVKAAAAVGLLSVTRFPGLARLTTAMLTLYFVLAVGAHVRVRDKVVNGLPAALFLTLVAAMTVKGPDQS
ncbi:DoxX family protein [Mycobacterium sp. Aquia_213]|uniref:DoxX family protein n=1 Tax=Mycobacterium sp. Aquia_213 TaxID=2991728 RepID=UPI00226DE720|nr:DoxX family protein [Mycobacterium sp. Aquia_213]WAC89489.1 DoxX family protein [Mycobacterium sp. Aquia_213]